MSDTPALPEPTADATGVVAPETPSALAAEGPAQVDEDGVAPADAGTQDSPTTAPPPIAAADGQASPNTPAEPAAAEAAATVPAVPKAPELSPAACTELLRQHFPALFSCPAKPIKLRIHVDIQQRAPGVFSKGALSAFFRRYTGSTSYLIALGKHSQRFDLDGQPAGELSEEHRQLARDELARRRNIVREREQQAQAQQMAAQAELLAERQARAALLSAFQRTTLTEANFCALKGITPEALAAQLAQARQEAAEAPPPRPPFNDRRGPPAGAPRGDGPPPRRDGRGPQQRPQQRGDGPPRGPQPGGRTGGGRPGSGR